MAAGMWQGLLAGYKNIEEKQAAREAKEEEILKRRRTIANALRPSMQKNLEMVEEQRSMLTYLEGRGLPKETINALYQDPETLKGAFQFARDGKGVDLAPEQLTDIFRVTQLGEEAPGDAYTALQSSAELYSSLDTAEDLDAFQELLYSPRTRTAVVETILPEDPKEGGVAQRQNSTWALQAQVYDRAVLNLAEQEYEMLDMKKESSALDEGEQKRYLTLRADIEGYSSNKAAAERIKSAYGTTAIGLIEARGADNPDFLFGLNNNPLIFDLGEAARASVVESFPRPETPEELEALPSGTQFIAPDGTMRVKA
jgi:hypothetical protein